MFHHFKGNIFYRYKETIFFNTWMIIFQVTVENFMWVLEAYLKPVEHRGTVKALSQMFKWFLNISMGGIY